MEQYTLLNIVEVKNKEYQGYCAQILLLNKLNPIQADIVKAYITKEERDYIAQYKDEVPITELFKVTYDFYKKSYKLKFNSSLIK